MANLSLEISILVQIGVLEAPLQYHLELYSIVIICQCLRQMHVKAVHGYICIIMHVVYDQCKKFHLKNNSKFSSDTQRNENILTYNFHMKISTVNIFQIIVYKIAGIAHFKLGQIWECQKCNILVIIQVLVLCLIYLHSSLGTVSPRASCM